jgi:hypothetical protein
VIANAEGGFKLLKCFREICKSDFHKTFYQFSNFLAKLDFTVFSRMSKLMKSFFAYILAILLDLTLLQFVISQSALATEIQAEKKTTEVKKSINLSATEPVKDNRPSETTVQPLPVNPTVVEAMEQVTSVSQLSDVQPTDWAFQALQSLVERYGVIAGYPDGTFRGNRAMTRYEFAAALNAALESLAQVIPANSTDFLTQEDLAKLQQLQAEFSAELASIRGRVDALEIRSAELEANQFSTTTILNGFAWFNLTGAGVGSNVKRETGNRINGAREIETVSDANTTFSNLIWLELTTSFTGNDALITQLAVGNGISPANEFASAGLFNTFGVPFTDAVAGVNANELVIKELSYSFPITDSVQLTVGPQIDWFRYFDLNNFTNFLTGASSFNSVNSTLVNDPLRGAGAILQWDLNQQLLLQVGYLSENNEFLPGTRPAADPSKGFFNGTNTITAELTYSPNQNANIRLLYDRYNIDADNGIISSIKPVIGVLDDSFGGGLNDATADVFGLNFDWLITPRIGIFGRYSYLSTHLDPVSSEIAGGNLNAQSVQAGLAFPNLGRPGALATLSYVIPFSILDGRRFLASGGGDGGVQFEIEATYYFPITDNLAIVPAFYVIGNPNNFSDNPTIFVGNLRTQFSF